MNRPNTARRPWPAYIVALTSSVLVMLETSKLNVALTSISASFTLDTVLTQLVTAGFILSIALSLLPFGRLGDGGSRRTLLLLGLGCFAAASAFCAIAENGWMLVIGRIAQGIATGMVLPQTIGLIMDLFTGRDRSKANAGYGIALALASVVGPIVAGGVLTLASGIDGWRALFWMNVPLAAALMILVARFTPRPQRRTRTNVDGVAIVIATATLGFVFFPFVTTSGLAGDAPLRWLSLVPGAIGVIALTAWERRYARRGRIPLIDFSVREFTDFRLGLVSGFGWYASTPALLLVLALHLQSGLGLDPLATGFAVTPFAIGAAIGSSWAVRHVHGRTAQLLVIGLVIGVLGVAAIAIVGSSNEAGTATLAGFAVAQLVAGLGGGLASSANQVRTLAFLPAGAEGSAGAIQQLSQRIANAVGLSGTVIAYYGVSMAVDERTGFVAGVAVSGSFLVIALVASLHEVTLQRSPRAA